MLKLLRKKGVSKKIFFILALIIIPAFGLWGIASVINKKRYPNYAGTIFGKKVGFDDFRAALYAWRVQLKLKYGDNAEKIAGSMFDPAEAAWDRLILLHEAGRRNIKVSDDQVLSALTKLPFLQKDGRFDKISYEIFLKYSVGLRPRIFEEGLREDLKIAKLYEQVTANVTVSEEEIKKEYQNLYEETNVKYVFFAADGFKNEISLKDEEVKAFYEESKEEFKIPPQINTAYLAIKFGEDTAQEQKSQARDTMEKALSVSKKKGLREAAKELNLEFQETGLFGFQDPIPTLGWMPQLSGTLFAIPKGELSGIISTERGIYIFEILDKKDAAIPEYKDAKDKARKSLLNKKSKEMASQKAKEFLSEAEKDGFEKAAADSKLEIKETPLFTRPGYIPELGMAQALKKEAFDLKAGELYKGIIELEQGFCIIKSVKTVPVDEEKFKKEKQNFSMGLLGQKRDEAFNKFFLELKKKANLVSYVEENPKK